MTGAEGETYHLLVEQERLLLDATERLTAIKKICLDSLAYGDGELRIEQILDVIEKDG